MDKSVLITLDKFEEAEQYWLDQLSGQHEEAQDLKDVKLPVDFPRTGLYERANFHIAFGRELSERILTVSKQSDLGVYIVLLTAFKILLFNYTGQEDIIAASPIYSAASEKYNKYVTFRTFVDAGLSFKELLVRVKKTVVEGYKKEYFPFDQLMELLKPGEELSLFRVALGFESIHKRAFLEDLIRDFENELTLFALKNQGELEAEITYNSGLYKKETVERFTGHYLRILHQVLDRVDTPVKDIQWLSEEEKNQVLSRFNSVYPDMESPAYPTIHELFRQQAAKTPDRRAVLSEVNSGDGLDELKSIAVEGVTYRELNESAGRLAHILQGKGVGRESHAVVGVSMHNSLELAVSLLGILKAGGAYVPIAPEYPEQRKRYMIEDSGIRVLVTGSLLVDTLPEVSSLLSMVLVDDPQMSGPGGEKPECPVLKNHPGSGLAYVIYTSGTTGKPKGVAVEHRGIVNYTHWRLHAYGYTEEDVTLQLLSNSFDGFGSNFYSGLLSGGALILVPEMIKLDVGYITGTIRENRITNISLVPGMYRLILDNAEAADLVSLRFVILAGESCGPDLIRLSREKAPHARLINEYGPTEATVTAAAHIGMDESSSRVIGKPIANVQIYILDKFLECVPVGVPGELCIGGIGVARGYLNNPELTAAKFINNKKFLEVQEPFFKKVPGRRRHPLAGGPYKIYRTGDLARWLPDGIIEFAGRMDQQVKIRGFRVEPAEIENQLLEHSEITGAVVLIKQEDNGETDLCAYIVSNNPLPVSEIREYLSDKLPFYMIPRFIVQIEKIPLTVNGKINRRVLPEPELKAEGMYIAPADRVEEQLAVIWSEVLGMEKEKISVDANFFQLGGHSLRATIMITKVHKALEKKIPLAEVFKNSTIRGLAEMIKGAEEDRYISIETALEKEYYPLSSAQERLYVLQQLAPESTLYNMPIVVELEGEVAGEKLEKTFGQLIQRHESLRTSFTRVEEQPVQKVHATHDVVFKIQHYTAGADEEVNRLINRFMGPFDLSRVPLMKVGMVKRNDKRYVLMAVMHHIIADGFSIGILINEFMTLYRGGTLPPLRLQYKDFSQWQNRLKQGEGIKKQETYWLKVFSGDIPVLKMPFDYPRPAQLDIEGDAVTFDLGTEIAGAVKELALQQGATLFMVLLALYCVLLSKLSGQEDIVVGTAVAGRNHPDLEPVIGMFLNMLAVRTFPKGEKTFKEFLAEVIDTTLQAYANQDYPFEDLVEKVVVNREANRHPLFDVGFGIQNIDSPTAAAPGANREPREPEVALKSYHFEDKTAKFDMNMLGSETGENVFFTIEYNTNLFKKETVERFIDYYKRLAASVIKNPNREIKEVEILTEEESKRIVSKKEEDAHAIQMDFDL